MGMEPDEKRLKQATPEEILQALETHDEQNHIEQIIAEQERLLAEHLQANRVRMQQAPPALDLEPVESINQKKLLKKVIRDGDLKNTKHLILQSLTGEEKTFPHMKEIGLKACCKCKTITQNHLDIVKHLIEMDTDVNFVDANGNSVLSLAAQHGHDKICELLLKNGANVNHINGKDDSVLFLAVCYRHIKTCKLLLKNGANANQADFEGYSPLIAATVVSKNAYEMCKLLLKHGANVNHANDEGHTALTTAACNGFIKSCELLLQNGANVNHADAQGNTALMQATWEENYEICELLLQNGANIEAENNEGNTALAHALGTHSLRSAQILLKHGANSNRHNHHSQSIIEQWIDADYSMVDYYDFSEELPFSTFVMLLEHGADPNIRNRVTQQTLLHACARNAIRCVGIIELLLQYNADHTALDSNNNTAFDLIEIVPRQAMDAGLDLQTIDMDHIGNILSDASTINAIKTRRTNNPRIEIPLTQIKKQYGASNAFTALFNREIGSHGKQLVIKRVQPEKKF